MQLEDNAEVLEKSSDRNWQKNWELSAMTRSSWHLQQKTAGYAKNYSRPMLNPCEKILVHKAPVYNTTATSLEMLNIPAIEADFNDPGDIRRVMKENNDIKGALIQYTRQKPDDRYDLTQVVKTIKECSDIPILTDDNYAAMKVSDPELAVSSESETTHFFVTAKKSGTPC